MFELLIWMSEEIEQRLKKLSDDKLMDIVRNFRQYGYDEDFQSRALSVLKSRGVDEEWLKLTGQYENYTYQLANQHYQLFGRSSKIAFLLYVLTFLALFVLPRVGLEPKLELTSIILGLTLGIAYFILLFRSFTSLYNFYKAIGKQEESTGAVFYFLFGMPLYVFMFFYFKQLMKEEMNAIN